MSSYVTASISEVEAERKSLNSNSGKQVQSVTERTRIREISERYFNEVRPLIVQNTMEGAPLQDADRLMQVILELTQKRSYTTKYRNAFKDLKKHLQLLDKWLVCSPSPQSTPGREQVDGRIVQTLQTLLPSAALSYEQALLDLACNDRLSWRGPATDLRESLRETLDHLAPDGDVTSASGYKQEKDVHGPTMKQKVRFILRNRNASKGLAATAEDAVTAVEAALSSFVRSVYTRSSISTHTPSTKDEALRVLGLVRVVLCELLEVR